MAEFVQQSIEEMLPELEQMERVGLFTTQQTRLILKKRKMYEYKLRRRTKIKEDYLQYIQYEVNVLSLLKKRRQSTGYFYKKVEIDGAIIHRIHKIFRLALTRFKDDVKLWLSYIEFSKQRGEKGAVSRQYPLMLQVHNKKPELWILAAKWEFEENLNPENARQLLQRGLRFLPESHELWLEYYRMELMYADKLRKRREVLAGKLTKERADADDEEMDEAVLSGNIAHLVYRKATEGITDDVNFVLSFIPICRLFDFTDDQEKQICQDLQSRYPYKEAVWDMMARRHLFSRGKSAMKDMELLEGEERCCEVYEDAIKRLNTDDMWTYYLKMCMERLELKSRPEVCDKRLIRTLFTFQRALDANHITSDLLEQWIEVLLNTGQTASAEQVAVIGVARYPRSVSLWCSYLRLLITCLKEEETVVSAFQSARQSVAEKESWAIWEITLHYLMSVDSVQIATIFELGLSSACRELCLPIKHMYLEWVSLIQPIGPARTTYSRLLQFNPVSLELYHKSISIEKSQPGPKIKRLRRLYEAATQEFGKECTEIWMDYVMMEMTQPKGKPENAGKIHFRAIQALEGELNQKFVTQYALLQTGHL